MYDLLLKNISRHISLMGEEADYFKSILKKRTLRKRQYLLQAGDISRHDALEDCELLLIEKPQWEKLFIEVPKFERFFRLLLQNAYVSMQRRIADNMSLSAEERYLNFITQYPHFEQRLPGKQIASYLGITPESLSRIRAKRVK